jgi:hypothetical protein
VLPDKLKEGLALQYRQDPVFFFEHALGVFTWSKMREILYSVRDYQLTAVRACHGSSKTFTAAGLVTWFFNTLNDSQVITTAPTFHQVQHLLWAEVGKLYRTSRVELIGECLTTRIKSDMAEHFALGFSTDKPQRAEGKHAPQLLWILDEAKGIEQWLWDSIRGAMGGGYSRLLAISTTDGVNAGEKFHSIFTDQKNDAKWNKIHIDVTDLPTFTGEKLRGMDYGTFKPIFRDVEDLNIQISTPKWDQDCKDDWGGDSILYLTKCRGEIVDETPDSIIKLSDVMKMFDNDNNSNFNTDGRREIGVDVARFGDDSSQFYMRKGLKVTKHAEFNKMDTHYLSNQLEHFVDGKKLDYEVVIKIDDTGVGGGVTDNMTARGYKNIVPVNFNQSPNNPDGYPNAISEMWFEVANIIDQISCPTDEQLKAELVNRKKLSLDKKGRRVVESKESYKKRFRNKSPDKADAFLLCFYNPTEQNEFFFGGI